MPNKISPRLIDHKDIMENYIGWLGTIIESKPKKKWCLLVYEVCDIMDIDPEILSTLVEYSTIESKKGGKFIHYIIFEHEWLASYAIATYDDFIRFYFID